jgi:phosphoglycerate dehydrogenase-like enzyme
MTAMVGTKWRFAGPIVERACKVVFAGPHFQASLGYTRNLLEEKKIGSSKIELIHAPTDEELMAVAPQADVALPFMQRFNKDFISSAQNLRLIMQYGVGLEGVDVEEATRQGIAVSNIPAAGSGNSEATSEHALLLSLSLLRHAKNELPRRFQAGELGGLPIPRTLYKKNVTVVGYGAVGSTLCRYLVTLGANVTAVRRKWPPTDNQYLEGIERKTTLQQALPGTDLLILACTMTPDTFHLINHETIKLLPKGALLVNVGRGPLVEYNAIMEALDIGAIGGFASDVGVGHPCKPSEPWDPSDPLSIHPNAYFTPHVGGYCDFSYGPMAKAVVDAVECVIRGEPPAVWVNRS